MWVGGGDPAWDKPRWDRMVASAGELTCRVEIWSGDTMLAESAPVQDGNVTDQWVTVGPRRKLAMTALPTRDWLRWLTFSSLEIRPYLGFRFSRRLSLECPMGRFPLDPPEMTLPSSLISIQADDYGIYLSDADFSDKPNQRRAGLITDAIADLVRGAGLPDPTVTATSTATSGVVVLDGSRLDAVTDAARSISAEVWLDRSGQPVIAEGTTLAASGLYSVLTGDGGTAAGVAVKPDLGQLYNVVSATSSAQGVEFPAAVASIGNTDHPAHPYRLGSPAKPRYKVLHYSSPLLMDSAQALKAATTMLTKRSALAGAITYTAFPDPARDASDTVLGATITGARLAQLQSVTHPFRAAYSTLTTVETQL